MTQQVSRKWHTEEERNTVASLARQGLTAKQIIERTCFNRVFIYRTCYTLSIRLQKGSKHTDAERRQIEELSRQRVRSRDIAQQLGFQIGFVNKVRQKLELPREKYPRPPTDEIERFVRQGMTAKDIASSLNASQTYVEKVRASLHLPRRIGGAKSPTYKSVFCDEPADKKTCFNCCVVKPLIAFYNSPKGRKGVTGRCVSCIKPHKKSQKLRSEPKTIRPKNAFSAETAENKTCLQCRAIKPLIAFYKITDGRKGVGGSCRICHGKGKRNLKKNHFILNIYARKFLFFDQKKVYKSRVLPSIAVAVFPPKFDFELSFMRALNYLSQVPKKVERDTHRHRNESLYGYYHRLGQI